MIIVAEGAMSRDGKPITSDQIKKARNLISNISVVKVLFQVANRVFCLSPAGD